MYLKPSQLLLLILVIFSFTVIQLSPLFAQSETVTDIDGNAYKTKKIGEQWWMAENLKATHYNNGDKIPFALRSDDWAVTYSPAFGFYNNDTSNISKFGLLYNWFVVDDEREVCPKGWHVPNDTEWMQLEKSLGINEQGTAKIAAWRGSCEGDRLKSISFGGNNNSGFYALGTGYRHPSGSYKGLGTDNNYWTSTVYYNKGIREGMLHGLLNKKSTIVRNHHTADYGFSIRCVKDDVTSASIQRELKIKIYPNPTIDKLIIENAKGEILSISTIKGKMKLSEKITSSIDYIDISRLKSGIFVVDIEGDMVSHSPIIIKK